jgi:hypothetical protein
VFQVDPSLYHDAWTALHHRSLLRQQGLQQLRCCECGLVFWDSGFLEQVCVAYGPPWVCRQATLLDILLLLRELCRCSSSTGLCACTEDIRWPSSPYVAQNVAGNGQLVLHRWSLIQRVPWGLEVLLLLVDCTMSHSSVTCAAEAAAWTALQPQVP